MRWAVKSADPALIENLVLTLKLSPQVARLLVLRGISEPEEAARFLSPSLEHLHSPYLMLGMDKAVARLLAAIERRDDILIYGDYDVDGTTAVVILKTVIELLGGTADFHVPHRIRDGYGMKDDVIERAAGAGVRLIISVDTGIRAFQAAETAKRMGVDLIVTDHHLPSVDDGVPQALAVLNPNQPGCGYPCKALCGAGVAFKLAQALLEKSGRERLLPSFIKMVAIATIADAVPLTGENRVFAKLGLEGLRHRANEGLKALFEVAELPARRAPSTGEIAFRIAPRLNAAGRMDVAKDVIELFTCKDAARARELANKLNQLNVDRQQEERRIIEAIDQTIAAEPSLRDAYCMVIDGDGWHRGVIGITATRVVEKYGRPAIVLSRDGVEAHGSGRSIPAFHLLDALESCKQLFTRYGGHAHAVGLGLPSARIPELRATLDRYAREQLTLADFEPSLQIDSEIALDEISEELLQAIEKLEPYGMANPEPVFALKGVRLVGPPRILKEKHFKLRLCRAGQNGAAVDAVAWRMAARLQQDALLAGDCVEVACKIGRNEHPDFGGLQLTLCDYRHAAAVPA